MSASGALQVATVAALLADTSITALVGTRIYDNPKRRSAYPYLSLESVQVLPDSNECVSGFEIFHDWHVWTQTGGDKLGAEAICSAIDAALNGAALSLAEPFALVLIEVEDWRVVGDPDGSIGHGIVSVRALVEG